MVTAIWACLRLILYIACFRKGQVCQSLQIGIKSLKDIDDHELQSQFHLFLKRLEEFTSLKSSQELEETNSKELIKSFSISSKMFDGIEHLMRATYEACIKLSVESVAESVHPPQQPAQKHWRRKGK